MDHDKPLRSKKTRSLLAFGLVSSLVLGTSATAMSQQKPAPAAPKQGAASASSAASAAPPPAEATTSAQAYTPPPPLVQPNVKKSAPPPPKPSDEQIAALERLARDVKDYEKDAKDFRDAITVVVKHHYEMRRRRVLSGLDKEIAIERAELRKARDEAIKRLEEFIARYTGPTAHQEHTPAAMFRLAALYEERGRTDMPPEELPANLKPAIALYKRIIREFPKYDQTAAVYYYLGHALNDASRQPEAQQVWRSLVCHNKYPYPVATDTGDPDKDLIYKKPQDHDEKWWDAWYGMHPDPIGVVAAKKGGKKPAPRAQPKRDPKKKDAPTAAETEPTSSDDEISYRSIYTEDCAPIPQKADPGKEVRYLAEVWWQIGDFHFDQADTKAGPFNYNRAVTAYRLSQRLVVDKLKNPVYGVALYKLAWTYFKQQRYEESVKAFVALLAHTEELEAKTGDPGADFRKEAYDYIAASLAYLDFVGPAEDEPFIVRSDVLDTETREGVAEQKMKKAIDRVQDPKIVPQDKKWTVEVYKALAREFREVNQLSNVTDVLELILQKWPCYREAPLIQDELAATYDERSRMMASKSAKESDALANKSLQARTNLAKYVGNTEWTDCNKDDPEAIQAAERLVKGGLRLAAVQHTNKARQYVQEGNASTDTSERLMKFEQALSEYKLAEQGWLGYLRRDEQATDAYESRFWVADSRYWQVALDFTTKKPIPDDLLQNARQAATEVRDSNEDDRFLEPSAQYLVAMADFKLNECYRDHEESGGARGCVKVDAVQKTGSGTELKIGQPAMSLPLQYAIAARDEYVGRVPANLDPAKNGPLYQFRAGEYFYLYGQWDEAKKRLEQVYKDQCKKSKWSVEAWRQLVAMAAVKADQSGSSEDLLVLREITSRESKPETSCRVGDGGGDACKPGDPTCDPALLDIKVAYLLAAEAFKKAQGMPDGAERNVQWKKAGSLYEAALQKDPKNKDAPEAAINGAIAYKNIGDFDKAIEMYKLFIDHYGEEKSLAKLEKGDAAEKADYQKRIGYLTQAYDALASSYVLFFNYRASAETLDKIARIERFPADKRKAAARNALVLYSNMGDREKMMAAREKFLTFKPSAEDKAEADFIVAQADLRAWDRSGAETDANKAARTKAMSSMQKFHDEYKRSRDAAKFTTIAAYYVAKAKQQQGSNADDWWKATIEAFKAYKSVDAKTALGGSQQGNMAAEADFTMVDADIKKNFDYDTGHHRYKGTAVDVIKKYQADAKDADKYHAKLKQIADPGTYGSIEYVAAALARQGSLYDSLRTGLFNTREPALQLFAPQEEKLLKQLEESGNQDLMDKAAEKRDARSQLWRTKRDQELTSADQIAVQRYTSSVVIARKYSVRSTAVNKAMQRLAFFSDVLGDDKMRTYSSGIEGFTYQEGMWQKTRPGMVVEPEPTVLPAPMPVLVQ
ncbi:MAG: tetratricopeptide repeat protein [Polyangiaceae bacterium]|nr:tetratricopeptide repeat protein [Polyangiaceae bacterium]